MTDFSGLKLPKRGAVHVIFILTMRINIYPFPVADFGFVGCEAIQVRGSCLKK